MTLEERESSKRRTSKPTNSANMADEPKQHTRYNTVVDHDSWIIGVLFHITPNKAFLFDLEEFNGSKVLQHSHQHQGVGNIRIVNTDGSSVILTCVRYMSRVLISDGMLENSRCSHVDTKQENSWFTGQCVREGARILYSLHFFFI